MSSHSLFETPPKSERIISVSALNQAVARVLEQNFPLCWVSGEISNFTRAASGHWYFTLKDQDAQVRAVMFRGRAQYVSFMPREGDKVEVRALVSLYGPRGDFQINVESMRRAGLGSLYEEFLRLKAKLEAEGLFDSNRKKAIPRFAKRIGVVTSPNAAALRDVLTALRRRAPHVEIVIYPTPVQGDGAAAKIAQAIASANADASCDVLIVCRGGGSIEDLWAFNEEIVARTIAHCELPMISGVGHETDFTITDFVADLRAPTPTAAAELACSSREEWLKHIAQLQRRLQSQMQRELQSNMQQLDWFSRRLISPLASLANKRQQLGMLAHQLKAALQNQAPRWRAKLKQLEQDLRLAKPQTTILQLQLANQAKQLERLMHLQLQRQHQFLQQQREQLELLSPQRTLERGYVILSNSQGQLIRSGSQLAIKQTLTLQTAVDITEIEVQARQKP